MSEESNTRGEQYQRARSAFDDLNVEERALFLVEAMASTLATGIERAAKSVSEELDKVINICRERASSAKAEETANQNQPDDYDPTNIPDA